MVPSFRGREHRARGGPRARIFEALICAVVVSGCSSKTLHSGGAGGSDHTGAGGKPSNDPSDSAGGRSAGENGGSGDPGPSGGQGGGVGAGGLGRGSGGRFGAGGFLQPGGGGAAPSGKGGAETASGGSAETNADSGSTPPSSDPIVPAVASECPKFVSGTITFMGLDGIRLAVGTTPRESRAPMLFYWHGTASSSDEYLTMAAPVASGILDAGGVIVSFQGTTGGDLYSGTSTFGVGDLTIADQLVACAVRDGGVDPRRIYAMGCSSGGVFSTAMAALRSSYIAAASPNSGGQVIEASFQNTHTPALMTVHEPPGTTLALDFAATSAAADKTFKAKGGFVIDCNTGAGHCGGSPLAPDVWQFFLAHPFGVNPEPWAASLPPSFSTRCKIQ